MRRRTGWSIGVVAAAVVIALVVARWVRPQAPADADATSSRPAEVTAPQSPPSRIPAAVSNEGGVRQTVSAKPTDATPVWDLCGLGRVPVPPGSSASAAAHFDLPTHLGAIPAAELGERTLAALKQGTPRQRAAALMLNMDPERVESAAAELAQLALSSKDPLVMSWAWSRCSGNRACGTGLARAWTDIEPTNAASWLALGQAEPAAAAEVRAGLVGAKHFSLRSGALAHEAMRAVPPDGAPYLRLYVAVVVVGFEAALGIPVLKPLTALCTPAPLPGSERQATCSAVAKMVIEHSDTLIGYAIGSRMAERAGWPAPRLAELRAERKRLDAASFESPMDMRQPMSCASVDGFSRYLKERGELGELAYLKRKAALHERR